jgi:hypothetical protein
MTKYHISKKELESLSSATPFKRYEYFIHKVCDWKKVYTLKTQDGFVLLGDNENELIPVWAFPEFCQEAIINEWENAEVYEIELDYFLDKWITGAKKDNRKFVVIPNGENNGVVVDSDNLLGDLEKELENY